MDMNSLMKRTTITLTLEDWEWCRKQAYEKYADISKVIRHLILEKQKEEIKNAFTTGRVEGLQKDLIEHFYIKADEVKRLHAILMKHCSDFEA